MNRCERCGKYRFSKSPCPCKLYECCVPEWDDGDWDAWYGLDEDDVAVRCVEKMDQGEYTCLNGSVICKVRDPETGKEKQLSVSAETDVVYYARET